MRYFLLFIILQISALQSHFYINEDVVNIYKLPSKESAIIAQFIYSNLVTIMEENNAWIKVSSPEFLEEGWITKDKIIEKNNYPEKTSFAKVKSLWAYLYIEKNTYMGEFAMRIPYNTKIEIKEHIDERWAIAKTLDDNLYYIQKNDLSFEDKILTIDEMINEAMLFLNIPYLFSGCSSYGFDCSGFVQVLFKQMDILLPKNSRNQSKSDLFEDVIDINNLQKADLLFFINPITKRINHVGLYLYDDLFIHASAGSYWDGKNCVKISSLKLPKSRERFIYAKRLNISKIKSTSKL